MAECHLNKKKAREKSQFCFNFSIEKILNLITETILFGKITRNGNYDYIYTMQHPIIVATDARGTVTLSTDAR